MSNPYAWERDYSTWYPAYYSGQVDEGEQPAVGDDSYEFAKLDTWEYGGGAGAINPYYDAYYYNRRFHPGANEGGIPDSERTKVAIDMFFLLASAYFVMFMLLPLVCACRIFPQEHRRLREIQAVVDGSRKVFELDDSSSNVTGLGKHADDDEPVCTMCLEPFAAGCTTSTLPCGHSFHSDCIKRWLVTTSFVVRTCPICRANPLRSPEERHDMSMHEEDGSLPICPPCPAGTNCHNWCSRWWASTSGGPSSPAAPTAVYPLMLRHVDLV